MELREATSGLSESESDEKETDRVAVAVFGGQCTEAAGDGEARWVHGDTAGSQVSDSCAAQRWTSQLAVERVSAGGGIKAV